MSDFKKTYERVSFWQVKTFPKSTAISKLHHLQKEVVELLGELTKDSADGVAIEREYADCLILLIGSASKLGIDSEWMLRIINEKMDINEEREWGEPNEQGIYLHIKQ